MGQAVSAFTESFKNKAEHEKNAMRKELETMMEVMESKLDNAQNKLLEMRWMAEDNGAGGYTSRDIGTGGAVSARVRQTRIVASTDINSQITAGLNDFFQVAFGIDQTNAGVVAGAKNLIHGAIAGVLGASSGSSEETTSFVILFVNFAFVRIDYYCYCYSLKAAQSAAAFARGGFCSLCEISIIPSDSLSIEEANYFMAQSMGPSTASQAAKDVERIAEMKMQLIESSLISAKLKDEELTFEEIQQLNKFLRGWREKRSPNKRAKPNESA